MNNIFTIGLTENEKNKINARFGNEPEKQKMCCDVLVEVKKQGILNRWISNQPVACDDSEINNLMFRAIECINNKYNDNNEFSILLAIRFGMSLQKTLERKKNKKLITD